MTHQIDAFDREGYIVEFIAERQRLNMVVNGRMIDNPRRYDKKAQLLAAWIIDALGLPVAHKNSWRAIDETLAAYDYRIAPAYAQKRGKALHSLYVITSDVPLPVIDWPTTPAKIERPDHE